MEKILISMPHEIAARFRTVIPARQRSMVIVRLITDEITRREQELTACAEAVENNRALNKEMKDWNSTIKDGLDDETW